MWISHHSHLMVLVAVSTSLITFQGVAASSIDLASQCSDNTFKYCSLSNLTSSYDDPLVVVNSTSLLKLESLIIRDSNMGRIPTSILDQCSNLNALTIYNSGLNRLSRVDFVTSPKIKKLIIMGNNFFNVPEQAFYPLSNTLEELNLSFNTLHLVNRKAFAGLFKLRYLDMQQNNIAQLSMGIFDDLQNLEYLDLSYNLLDVIDSETFGKNLKLGTIILRGNLFHVFEPNSLSHLKHINRLDLGNSAIDEIQLQSVDVLEIQNAGLKKLTILAGVVYLNASNNDLKSLDIKNKECVNHMSVSNNQFDSLDDFVGMLNLKTLDVSNNRLVNLTVNALPPFLPFPNLQCLNVAFNSLETIHFDDLILLNKLKILNVASNKLKRLETKHLESLKNLEYLYVEGNQLREFDIIEMKRNHLFLHEIAIFPNPLSSQALETALKFQHNNISLLTNRQESSIPNHVFPPKDVPQFVTPIKPMDLRGVTGIHPYWTLRDILALITLIIVFFILLMLFFHILQEDQCCQRIRNARIRRRAETEPLRTSRHERLVEDNSPV